MEAFVNDSQGHISLGQTPSHLGETSSHHVIVPDQQGAPSYTQIAPAPHGTGSLLIGSTHPSGTFVNEPAFAPCFPHPLRSGDVIRRGSTHSPWRQVSDNRNRWFSLFFPPGRGIFRSTQPPEDLL